MLIVAMASEIHSWHRRLMAALPEKDKSRVITWLRLQGMLLLFAWFLPFFLTLWFFAPQIPCDEILSTGNYFENRAKFQRS